MSLPTIKNANFSIKVKEIQKPLQVRRMIVAENKAIQQATDLGNEIDVSLTIANITASCTNDVINSTTVPQYLLDFVFLQIYINSVENKIESKYVCHGFTKDPETNEPLFDEETGDAIRCNNNILVKIPLDRAEIIYPDKYEISRVINISEEVKLKLKGLTLQQNIDISELQKELYNIADSLPEDLSEESKEYKDAVISINELKTKIAELFFYYSIDSIVNEGNDIFPEKDFNKEEFVKWINECPSNSVEKVEEFYENIPYLNLDLSITCPKCGNKHETKLRGLQDFFS